jgi:DNA-directed RNA polymerase subunit H
MEKFNILAHELVPAHKILSDKEAKKVLKAYNIEPDQLPKILDNDPVIKAIGAKPGQIIKIIRKSELAGENIAYRLVVDSKLTPLRT